MQGNAQIRTASLQTNIYHNFTVQKYNILKENDGRNLENSMI